MTDYPYPIGAVVEGSNFRARVVGYRGPLTPILSDGYVTPASLIHRIVSLPEAGHEPPAAAPEPAEQPGQLMLL